MPEAGGPSTQAGVQYQNAVTVLWLARALNRESGIQRVRPEAPFLEPHPGNPPIRAAVDDIRIDKSVRGQGTYCQVKISAESGKWTFDELTNQRDRSGRPRNVWQQFFDDSALSRQATLEFWTAVGGEGAKELCDRARGYSQLDEFEESLTRDQNELFSTLQTHLSEPNGGTTPRVPGVPRKRVWRFLQQVHVLQQPFESVKNEAIAEIRAFAGQGDAQNGWNALYAAVAAAAVRRKEISRADVVDLLRLAGVVERANSSPTLGVGLHPRSLVEAAVSTAATYERVVSYLGGDVDHQLEDMRLRWREGDRGEPLRWIRRVREDAVVWDALPDTTKAKVLRFEAGVRLQQDDEDTDAIDYARQLLDEARGLAPSDSYIVVEALIARKESGPEAAVEALAGAEDVDARNLLGAYLLEMGRTDDARAVLARLVDAGIASAETFRVRALIGLADRQLNLARADATEALRREPTWELNRYVDAVVAYYESIAEVAVPRGLRGVPEPLPRELFKEDASSIELRRRAARTFRELADRAGPDSDTQRRLEAWWLASALGLPELSEAAEVYCRRELAKPPVNVHVAFWALAYKLGVDWGPVEAALVGLIGERRIRPDQAALLIQIHLSAGQPHRALDVLTGLEKVIDEQNLDSQWELLRAVVNAANGGTQPLTREIPSGHERPEQEQVELILSKRAAIDTGDWRPYLDALESALAADDDPIFRLERFEALAQLGEWEQVEAGADWLLEHVGTPAAVSLAVYAAHRLHHHGKSVGWIEAYGARFSGTRLPSDLRRIKIVSLREMGDLPQAISEATALVRDDPSKEHLLIEADLHVRMGNLRSLGSTARILLAQPDLGPREALWLSETLKHEDRALAVDLWRRAHQLGLDDAVVGSALALGFQLGLDRELAPLTGRATRLAQTANGGFRPFTVEEFLSFERQRLDNATQRLDAYTHGRLPVHYLRHTRPLPDLYHGLLQENASDPDPLRQAPVYIRHGGRGRPIAPANDDARWRLNADVTALLLAHHLDLLRKVEAAFAPVRVPDDLMPALLHLREKLVPHQPSRIDAARQVLDEVTRGGLQVVEPALPDDYGRPALVEEQGPNWVALFEAARASGGYLVDFLPVRAPRTQQPSGVLPDGAVSTLTDCRSVLESLWEAGPLSRSAYEASLDALGVEGSRSPGAPIPQQGRAVYLSSGIGVQIADAGLLRPACRRFNVCIASEELARLRELVAEHERRSEAAQWLDELIARVSRGISQGTYRVIPRRASGDPEPAHHADGHTDECLRTLLELQPEPQDVVWVDDRSVNAYARATAPIIGTSEVLDRLLQSGALDQVEYYARLGELRASNARYLPVSTEEILHLLRQARVADGALVETHALAVLRRYVAACLVQGEALQRPPMPGGSPNPLGEAPFVLGLSRAIGDALVALWETAENEPETDVWARAEWLLANLYLDDAALITVSSLRRDEHDRHSFAARSYAGLLTHAITLWPAAQEGDSPRWRYYHWLMRRMLRDRIGADPHLVGTVVDLLKQVLLGLVADYQGKPELRTIVAGLRSLYRDLPDVLRVELGRNSDLMASLGLRNVLTVEVGGLRFRADEYWRAASAAMNGREASIPTVAATQPVAFRPAKKQDQVPAFALQVGDADGKRLVIGHELALLSDSIGERQLALEAIRDWFDCSDEVFRSASAEIAALEDPRARVEEALRWRRLGATGFYRALRERLSNSDDLVLEGLLPEDEKSLVDYLRLQAEVVDEPFAARLEHGASALLAQVGLERAIERFAALPSSLPTVLTRTFLELNGDQRSSLTLRLMRTVGSPMSRAHMLRLLRLGEAPAERRLANLVARRLVGEEGRAESEAFVAVLRWTNAQLSRRSQFQGWASESRLAAVWVHGHKLWCELIAAGAPPRWIGQTFGSAPTALPLDLFSGDRTFDSDAAHPRRLSPGILALTSLAHGLGETAAGLDADLREDVLALVFSRAVDGSGDPQINVPFFRDTTLSPNAIESFLAGDLGPILERLLGAPWSGRVGSQSLRNAAVSAVAAAAGQHASAQTRVNAWVSLLAIWGGSAPYPELIEDLRAAVAATDFAELCRLEPEGGAVSLMSAAQCLHYLHSEDLSACMRDEVRKAARAICELDSAKAAGPPTLGAKTARACQSLLQAGLHVCLAWRPDGAAQAFGELVREIAENCPSTAALFLPVILRLCEELPIAQAAHLWRTLVFLRAV